MPDAKYCPREPTPEMMDAGRAFVEGSDWWSTDLIVLAGDFWRAMYDAAPAQAEPHHKYCPMAKRGSSERLWNCTCGPLRATAAPAQAEPRDDHSLDYIADEYVALSAVDLESLEISSDSPDDSRFVAAPSPAAEDGLVDLDAAIERATLAAKVSGMTAPTREEAIKSMDVAKQREEELRAIVAARIERQAQEIADLRDKIEQLRHISNVNGDWSMKYSNLLAERDAELRRAEALRLRCLTTKSGVFRGLIEGTTCSVCRFHVWFPGEPERHAEGCLASPAAQGDDRG